jgi:hypothetical protein
MGREVCAAYTIALTPRQYLSHMERKRGCPPRSHSLIVTLPLVTLRMLKPTVGIMSSEKPPVCADHPGRAEREWHRRMFAAPRSPSAGGREEDGAGRGDLDGTRVPQPR